MDFTWVATPATADKFENRFLRMSGDINTGDYERFRVFMQKNLDKYKTSHYIELSSNGGNVVEALKIAGLLRLMYPTINVEQGKCASACFFLFLSGASRYTAASNLIGIHRAYFDPKYFSGLPPLTAKRKQEDLTKAVNVILDDNGVPQYLKETMNRTSSNDMYWLSDKDIAAIGRMPAWYEEFMIAKCNYGEVLTYRNDVAPKIRNKIANGEEVDKSILAESATRYIRYKQCEKKIVNEELTNLSAILTNGKH